MKTSRLSLSLLVSVSACSAQGPMHGDGASVKGTANAAATAAPAPSPSPSETGAGNPEHNDVAAQPVASPSPLPVSGPAPAPELPVEATPPAIIAGAFLSCIPNADAKVSCFVQDKAKKNLRMANAAQSVFNFVSDATGTSRVVPFKVIASNDGTLFNLDLSADLLGLIVFQNPSFDLITQPFKTQDLNPAQSIASPSTAFGTAEYFTYGNENWLTATTPGLGEGCDVSYDATKGFKPTANVIIAPTKAVNASQVSLLGICGLSTYNATVFFYENSVTRKVVKLLPGVENQVVFRNLQLKAGSEYMVVISSNGDGFGLQSAEWSLDGTVQTVSKFNEIEDDND